MDFENTDDHLPSGQSKKLLAFTVVAALTSLPVTGVQLSIVDDLASAFHRVLVGFMELVASIVAQAIFGSLGYIFTAGTEEFLFFTPPGQIPSLRTVWLDLVPVFFGILTLGGLAFFVMMMLFPEKEEADIYRFMERALVAGIGLVLLGPVFTYAIYVPDDSAVHAMFGFQGNEIHLDIMSAAIFAVNEIGYHIFPDEYTLRFMQGSINSIMGGLTALGTAAASIAAIVLIGWKFALGVLLTVGTFYIILAMRMLLIYTVYALMPLFLSLWVVDIGPMKYGKMVSSLVFKLTAVLLLLGIVISGILATTSAIAGQDTTDEIEFADGYDEEPDDGLIGEDGEIDDAETAPIDGGETASTLAPKGFSRVLLQLFAWFGGLVLSVAMTTSLLGMIISMRGGTGTSSRMRQGRSPDAPTGPQVFGGGGGGGSGSGGGSNAAVAGASTTVSTSGSGGGGGGTAAGTGGGTAVPVNPDEPTITRGDDATFINPANSDEKVVIGDDYGEVSSFEQQDTGPEEVPLSTKAGHVGKRVGSKANDYVESKTGVDVADGIRERGQNLYDRVPAPAKNAGNLLKRGGSAYWSVFKQPDPMSSIGEARRIARESPIGHPRKGGPEEKSPESTPGESTSTPDGNSEDDPENEDDDRKERDDSERERTQDEYTETDVDRTSNTTTESEGTDTSSAEESADGSESELGSADDLNLPDGKDTVIGTLEDNDISSPVGHEGYTRFESAGDGSSGGASDDVDLDGSTATSGSVDSDRPDDLNLPDDKDTVIGTLEDNDISSPVGHEGFTRFESNTGSSDTGDGFQHDTVVVDGENSVSGPQDTN